VEGKRGSECLLKSVSNIDFNPDLSGLINLRYITTARSRKLYGHDQDLFSLVARDGKSRK